MFHTSALWVKWLHQKVIYDFELKKLFVILETANLTKLLNLVWN